jgi:hypothetical protein
MSPEARDNRLACRLDGARTFRQLHPAARSRVNDASVFDDDRSILDGGAVSPVAQTRPHQRERAVGDRGSARRHRREIRDPIAQGDRLQLG